MFSVGFSGRRILFPVISGRTTTVAAFQGFVVVVDGGVVTSGVIAITFGDFPHAFRRRGFFVGDRDAAVFVRRGGMTSFRLAVSPLITVTIFTDRILVVVFGPVGAVAGAAAAVTGAIKMFS